MQNYKVHAYVISMEFLAVNRRRPSRETPLGAGAKKDGCFRRLLDLMSYNSGSNHARNFKSASLFARIVLHSVQLLLLIIIIIIIIIMIIIIVIVVS